MKPTLLLIFAVAASIAVLLTSAIPLGIPGEWTWPRQALPQDLWEAVDRFLGPLLSAAAIVAFARFGDCRINSRGPLLRCLLISGLVVASFFWLRNVREAAASPHREIRSLWVLYDKYATGYFYETVFQKQPASELLATYEARMAKGDVLHEGTHPPGLLLLNTWALEATQNFSSLATLARFSASTQSSAMYRALESQAAMARPLSDTEFAALCLVSFLSSLVAAATVIPVFLLVNRLSDTQTAWRAACLTLSIPSVAIFVPRSDVIYCASGMWLLALIVLSLTSKGTVRCLVGAAAAACILFADLAVSLAHLPILFAGCVFCVLSVCLRGEQDSRPALSRLALMGVTAFVVFAALVFGFNVLTNCNLLNVWRLNLRNHQAFYSTSPRTWWMWALVNPVELSFAAGMPLTIVASFGAFNSIRASFTTQKRPDSNDTRNDSLGHSDRLLQLLVIALLVTWAILWLSGKNMGEAARLWCFLTPWCAIAATLALTRTADSNSNAKLNTTRSTSTLGFNWLVLLTAQLLLCAMTTGLVSGYLEL